ncbi:unnamed protein product, partial [Musa acuminata var. zebrina]
FARPTLRRRPTEEDTVRSRRCLGRWLKADSIPIYEAEKKSSTWQTSSLYPQRDNASWVVGKSLSLC